MDNFPLQKFMFVYLLGLVFCHVAESCSGFSGVGHTYPMGDILIEDGSLTPLEITCVITDKDLIRNNSNISSKLYFKKDNSNVTDDKIIRLNSTSIKLVNENPKAMSNFYTCMLENRAICLNSVRVGTKPQKVMDFKCIGYNFENLTCSWTPPLNYIPTNYSLSYNFPDSRSGGRFYNCTITENKETGQQQCFWSVHTRPYYQQIQKVYKFILRSVNRFGVLEQVIPFNHLQNIVPAPPKNLTWINSTVSSLFLFWEIPHHISPIETGLEHRVLYQCTFGPRHWQYAGSVKSESQQANVTFNLTGLPHAHDICDIRVSIRVNGTESEEMWSANSSITALTNSTIPDVPPKVNVGSLQTEIESNLRDIYVYWQQIPPEMKNGEDFQYRVTISDNHTKLSKTMEVSDSYVKFTHMSLRSTYEVAIQSKNAVGLSKRSAKLTVPANDRMISEPTSFTKVAFGGGFYKLSWQEPKRGAQYVENYTLFWCSDDKDRPFQCKGYLNWTELPKTTTEYNLTLSEENTTQFAISANNATSTSGMSWATCTLIHNKGITKITDVWIVSVGSTRIKLQWKLYCADKSGSVAGYVVYYCQRAKEPDCLEQKNITVNDPYADTAEVTGLTPYTTYMLTVSVVGHQGSTSPESDPLYNTTYEAAPSEPYHLTVTNVTNTTVSLTWKAPKKLNGYLRYYYIRYNKDNIATNDNSTSYTLEGLSDDTTFNISVSACTLYCSEKSRSILVRTRIGYPGRIANVWITKENNTLILHWSKPVEPRRVSLYEIRTVYKNDDGKNITLPIANATANRYNLVNCKQNAQIYYVSIRAVSLDNNTNYTGPWADEFKASCDEVLTDTASYVWIGIVTLCILLICGAVISGKRLYISYNEMKTVDVKLPPGLDPQIDTNWTESKTVLNQCDEEHLLNKGATLKNDDSSGCSSAQESVGSDSVSNISGASDSGTEQPLTPTDVESKPTFTDVDTSNRPYVALDWKASEIDNSYSMCGTSDVAPKAMESQYVSCDQIQSAVDGSNCASSYVPLNNSQNNSPPYVMAANKNEVSPNRQYPNVLVTNTDEKPYVQVASIE